MPWYRQFWPWFLIALPAAAVAASLATVWIAVADPDGLVVADYYREGLAINQNLQRQRAALDRGLAGQLNFDPATGNMSVSLQPGERHLQEVKLRLVHPTRAAKDLSATLYRDMTGKLTGAVGFPADARWQVVIVPADDSWQLSGKLELPGPMNISLTPG